MYTLIVAKLEGVHFSGHCYSIAKVCGSRALLCVCQFLVDIYKVKGDIDALELCGWRCGGVQVQYYCRELPIPTQDNCFHLKMCHVLCSHSPQAMCIPCGNYTYKDGIGIAHVRICVDIKKGQAHLAKVLPTRAGDCQPCHPESLEVTPS